jgi:dephospho-CoA kinase
MLKIGLTGSIGSGKTTVSRLFKELNVPIYYSDKEARYITDTQIDKIAEYFGEDIINEDNTIDRKKLGTLVFTDPEKLEWLNRLIHPLVNEHFKNWCNEQNSPYIIHESAIIFEKGLKFDKVITVSASKDIRLERVMKRNNLSKEEVLNVMNNQMPDEDKVKLADFVIINNGTDILKSLDELRTQVFIIHNILSEL